MSHPSIHAKMFPDKPAFIMAESGERVTYRELDENSNRFAHLFRQLGLKAGDHITVMMENNRHFMQLIWGAQRSGLIYTTVSTHLTVNEAAYIFENSDARVVVTSQKYVAVVESATANCANVEHSFIADSAESVGKLLPLQASISGLPITPIADQCGGMDMLYSSGTTGKPKGIAIEFEAKDVNTMLPVLQGLTRLFGFTQETVYLSPAPLYHAAPLRFNMMTMFQGGTSIIMEKFDPEISLQLINKYRVTHSQWVPIMFKRLLDLPESVRHSYDLSTMQCAIHAAAPCSVAIKEAMFDWWGDIIYEYYSSTESIGTTMISPQEWRAHPGSVGKAISGVPHIMDEESGDELPIGRVGVIYFSGGLPVTYHHDPVKTLKAINDRGWYTCGDVGYLDQEGYLYLTDRKDFVIISGGVNIYPQESEDVIVMHPAVADVAVFGIPNEEFGQEVKAVVELRSGVDPSEQLAENIIGFCRDRISKLKCPRSVDFIKKLPRMENGKLYKKELAKQYH